MDTVQTARPTPMRSPATDRRPAAVRPATGLGVSRWKFLAEASIALEASLDYQVTLSNVVRLAVPAIADYGAIALRAADGTSYWAANAYRDDARSWLPEQLLAYSPRASSGSHPVLRELHGLAPQIVREIDEPFLRAIAHDAEHLALLRALAPTSYLSAPMFARGQVFGTLVLCATAESGRRFGPRDAALAQETARRAALAVDHATMFRAAQQAARVREAVLATVSHDLKNPLSTIMLAAGFLLEELVPPDDAHAVERRQLQVIERAAGRMRRLVGDLLDASALEAGRLHVQPGPHEASTLLDDAMDALAPQARARGVALVVHHTDAALVLADRDRVLQVFTNLGGNAIKFTPPGGCVTLSATTGGDRVRFGVADTGPGIAPDDLPLVFDRFWQAPDTARLGSGLGLSIARGIVEAHGGDVHASSVVGEGSIFAFTLPIAPSR